MSLHYIQELGSNLLNIYTLYHNTFDDDIRMPWSKIEKKLKEKSRAYVFTENATISGFVIWTPLQSEMTAYIDYFCVSKSFQGKGLGSKYLKEIISYLEQYYQYILLDCKSNVIKFYENFGFCIIAQSSWDKIQLSVMLKTNYEYKHESIMKIYKNLISVS
jgi:ribosomal protein S18 acetylase RimI-like enzyme